VVERTGKIKRTSLDSADVGVEVILDLSDRLGELGAERGLVSAEWHPQYPTEPYLYVAYSYFDGTTYFNRLSRFTAADQGPNAIIDPSSEQVLIDMLDRHNWHNGGGLKFGPDGFLYYGVGDEGSNNDGHQNSQKINRNLFSGVLRLDVDRKGNGISHPIQIQPADGQTAGYYVPSDNPFVGVAGALEEFFAIGMRNPYRFSFDSDGRLWSIDVGQDRYEEINIIESGGN